MTKTEKINRVLRKIDEEKPYCLDNLRDEEVNNIKEIKEALGVYKIKGFSVIRDNQKNTLADGSTDNVGNNRLVDFNFKLVVSTNIY